MNWAAMMRLAAGRFAIAPEAFWRLSVREWAGLTGAGAGPAMTRAELTALEASWPDGGRR